MKSSAKGEYLVVTTPKTAWIVVPVFNDYKSLYQLLLEIDNLRINLFFNIVVVDDASDDLLPDIDYFEQFVDRGAITEIGVLKLRSNSGNQSAISHGLQYAFDNAGPENIFIVMDADGEDSPQSIPILIDAMNNSSIVVAKRSKPKKNIILLFWHTIFKSIFRILIGKSVNFGNFSLLNYEQCQKIVSNRKLKISYIGTLLRSGITIERVQIDRGRRYEGKSRTDRDGLFTYGFQILTVYADKIYVKLLRIASLCLITYTGAILYILFEKLFTSRNILGWSSTMIAILGTSILQLIVILVGLIIIQINSKSDNNQSEAATPILKVKKL